MDFLFKPQDKLDKAALYQGDLLARTPVLQQAIGQAHGYYAQAEDYTHFMVLTQSCDLVRRGSKPAKSRYVSLAACRPVSVLLDRYRAKQAEKLKGWPEPLLIHSTDKKVAASQLLERLLHNTEDGHFFIRKNSVEGVPEDLCAFLPLSIALRAEQHYDVCANSKIAELEDVFAAKLGWLVGNLYARVGTPDLEDMLEDPRAYKSAFIDEFLKEGYKWLSPLQIRRLLEDISSWESANRGATLDEATASAMLRAMPASEEILADQIVRVLTRNRLIDPANVDKASKLLANDRSIKRVSSQIESGEA